MSIRPSFSLTPRTPYVLANTAARFDILLRIVAPEVPESAKKQRSRLNLVFVGDRSTSMQGKPFEETKNCIRRMVKGMQDDDMVTVVLYDSVVETVCGPVLVKEIRHSLDSLLAPLRARGMTALHGGWLAGADKATDNLGKNTITRVILLSDGNANVGLAGEHYPGGMIPLETICGQVAQMAEVGVSTSTYGLGLQFNEDLMTEMARLGGGSAYFGETADDLWPNFEAEFDILSATVARDIKLKVTQGTATVENLYRTDKAGNTILPNAVGGAETWALLKLDVPKLAKGESTTLEATVTWIDLDDMPHTETLSLTLTAVGKSKFADQAEDTNVAERAKELEAAAIQRKAKEAVKHGDWDGAKGLVGCLRGLAGDNAYISGIADTLDTLVESGDASAFSKEATFAAYAMSTRYKCADEDHTLMAANASTKGFMARRSHQGKTAQDVGGSASPDQGIGQAVTGTPGIGDPLQIALRKAARQKTAEKHA
jgi:Ca-activated chloride channel family protein